VSNAPVCHVSTGSVPIKQPRATLLPTVPVAVDLPSALAAINALKLLIQVMSGQQGVGGARGGAPSGGLIGGGGIALAGSPGSQGQKGKDAKDESGGRFVEDRKQRVVQKKRIFQDNDKTSENWVDIAQINKVVWVDKVTGETIVWVR
jgi:hypothetical protein